MSKLPAFQFYPGDWMKDPALRSVSVAGRGLWIDLLCLLFESETRCKMDFNGEVDESTLISRMTGVPRKQVNRLLGELERAGVFSRDAKGMIYSRRMKRDQELRLIRAQCGKLGGNPALLNQKLNREVNHTSNQSFNQKPTPSSSSSTSVKEAPPTLEEVKEHFKSLGYLESDGEEFFYHHDANGWIRGKSKIRKWRSAVAYWITRMREFKKQGPKNGRFSASISPGEAYERVRTDKPATVSIP